jgi:thioredoxin 1
MLKSWRTSLVTLILAAVPCLGQQASVFPPLEGWRAAVIAGDAGGLAKLYSTDPPAIIVVGNKVDKLNEEVKFWATMKDSGLTLFDPKILEATPAPGRATRLLLRVVLAGAISGKPYNEVASVGMVWMQQPKGWRIVSTQRGDFANNSERRLPEPAKPNTSLYSDPAKAPEELKAALARATKENKRVITVFGGNWCYDCHVLDTTFHSKDFAPLVEANYVVVHINIGDEGKDNNDLAAKLGVALDKGVPSLGVLAPDGKVIFAQKNGEFESTVKIGLADVRAFLEKWKPAGRK